MNKRTKTIKEMSIVLSLLCLILCGCGDKSNEAYSKEVFAMDTHMTVTGYGEQAKEAVEEAENIIYDLEARLSIGRADSEISILNKEKSAILSSDTSEIVQKALEVYDSTGGVFDITIFPVVKLWGFSKGELYVPNDDELEKVMSTIDSSKIVYEAASRKITLADNQEIDLGGIAKGYTSNEIMKIFNKYNLTCGIVNLGGNVQCYKRKPNGETWKVGIQSPFEDSSNDVIASVDIDNKAVVTSGGYQRFFVDNQTGKLYHHIIDPKDGHPVDNEMASVSIISSDGTLCDALSTACFVMGKSKAIDYWKSSEYDFDMVMILKDSTIFITDGIEKNFKTDLSYEVVRKNS